jgi:hypothetical protein
LFDRFPETAVMKYLKWKSVQMMDMSEMRRQNRDRTQSLNDVDSEWSKQNEGQAVKGYFVGNYSKTTFSISPTFTT